MLRSLLVRNGLFDLMRGWGISMGFAYKVRTRKYSCRYITGEQYHRSKGVDRSEQSKKCRTRRVNRILCWADVLATTINRADDTPQSYQCQLGERASRGSQGSDNFRGRNAANHTARRRIDPGCGTAVLPWISAGTYLKCTSLSQGMAFEQCVLFPTTCGIV